MTAPLLRYDRVSKSFFGVPVLRDVSFELGAGRVLGLVGENGAGKSTLMNVLGGILAPDGGALTLAGRPYAPTSPIEAAARGVAFIHQELNLFPNLGVAENIFIDALPRRRGLVDRRALHARARELLAAVDLDVAPETPVEALSPGQRQLVEIARALSTDARVVIFDEPTTSLTARESERLFALIQRLRAEGRGIIYISHALGDVMRLADDVLILRDGQVVASGPASGFTAADLVRLMVGRELSQVFPERAQPRAATPLLEVEGVSQPGIVEDVSFTLHAGEVLGLAGLMGSGRTELARILFGLDPHARGTIALRGQPLGDDGPRGRIARGMAFLTESRRDEGLVMDASVAANAALAALPGYARGGAGMGVVDGDRLDADVARVCRAVRIPDQRAGSTVVRTLSGGNQQKVVLARWLLTAPSVFILDEPTRGIDVGAKHDIYVLIQELVARGSGVLVISSELEELIGLCDRILVMRQGEIAGELARAEFDDQAIMRLAFGQETAA